MNRDLGALARRRAFGSGRAFIEHIPDSGTLAGK
jgi:hypothetical protein